MFLPIREGIDYTFINIEFTVQQKKLSHDVFDTQKISGESLLISYLFRSKTIFYSFLLSFPMEVDAEVQDK